MIATSRFLPSAISPSSVHGPSASTWPTSTRCPSSTIGRWLAHVPWLERSNLRNGSSRGAVVVHDGDVVGRKTSSTTPVRVATIPRRHRRQRHQLHAGTDQRCLGLHQRHRLALHVGAHRCTVGVVVLRNGIIAVATDTIWRGLTSMYWTDGGRHVLDLGALHTDEHALVGDGAVLVVVRVGLADDVVGPPRRRSCTRSGRSRGPSTFCGTASR